MSAVSSITFQHGQAGHHPDFPRRTAPGALESAARLLGVPAPATGAASARERGFRKGRQERDLDIWARENGCWIEEPARWLALLEPGGEEHRIFDERTAYLKATYPGRYGFTIVAGPVYPGRAPALPAESLVLFTLQPTVVGEAARPDEIIAFMQKRRLQLLNGAALGTEGALCFYRDLDQLAVFDAHPANVLKDGRGVILPIDLIVLTADDALAKQLNAALS